jgi:hypothetical protein
MAGCCKFAMLRVAGGIIFRTMGSPRIATYIGARGNAPSRIEQCQRPSEDNTHKAMNVIYEETSEIDNLEQSQSTHNSGITYYFSNFVPDSECQARSA